MLKENIMRGASDAQDLLLVPSSIKKNVKEIRKTLNKQKVGMNPVVLGTKLESVLETNGDLDESFI